METPLTRFWRGLRRVRRVGLSLALQGGGSHGAFTWGVLDRLLEEDWLELDGLSGASAGAMNAVVVASGYVQGGRQGAKQALHAFWHRISEMARLTPLQATPIEGLLAGWNRDWSPGYLLARALTKLASPYLLNPAGLNPLLGVLEDMVDFPALRRCRSLKLFVSATNVHSGQLRLLRNPELTPQALAASACLPLLFHAVELDGEHYWDGGYSANPALSPLIFECDSADVVLVQLSPLRHPDTPRSLAEILDRAAEIGFNAGLIRELQLLAQLAHMGGNWPSAPQRRLRRLRLHQIHSHNQLFRFGRVSRINAEWPFLVHLRDMGRRYAEEWLSETRDALGRRPSVPIGSFALQ